MNDHPNYRDISAPPPHEKPYTEYTYVERRALIYDMIEKNGHYRNIGRSQREIGEQFGVSHTTIGKDIRAINEFIGENVGDNAEVELESLKNTAVQTLIDEGKPAEAYKIMKEHYVMLQEMGVVDREPEKVEMEWREYIRDEE